ncbi:MAG: class B sortase [Roseburia sp.]|nr:class B sortase [Roseburia sp.]MCM1243873.1 class B sortase [Roseburia sp.]
MPRIEESAQDAYVDFATLKEINPDIFAWLYIPGTDIDCPILQNSESDTFYETHNFYAEEDMAGSAYIEIANLTNMCDFNTVIHGNSTVSEEGLFGDLYQFLDLDFFETHEPIYLYLEDNVLTYEIFAVYERENTSLLRSYDFTAPASCQTFLDTIYDTRDMNMKLREGWSFVNPYHFLITLTTQKEKDADTQLVVVAVLIKDIAGNINRIIYE